MKISGPREKSRLDKVNQHFQHFLKQILLLVLFALIPAAIGQAQQKFELTVFGGNPTSAEGFQFRHVEIATVGGLPAVKDQTVWCHLELQNSWGESVKLMSPSPVTLKAGEVLVEKDLYLPSGGAGGFASFSLDPRRDSSQRRLLQMPMGGATVRGYDVLFIDGNGVGNKQVAFDARKRVGQVLTTPLEQAAVFCPTSPTDGIYFSAGHSKIPYLPKRWIGYSCTEQIVIDRKELAKLAFDVERFEALAKWVTMGGTLVVCDCGKDFRSIPLVMRSFKDAGFGVVPELPLYFPAAKVATERAEFVSGWEMGFQYGSPPAIGLQGLRAPVLQLPTPAGKKLSNYKMKIPRDGFAANWNEAKFVSGENGGLDSGTHTDVLLHRFGLGRVMFHSDSVEDLLAKEWLGVAFLGVVAQRQFSNSLGTKNVFGDSIKEWQLLNVGVAPIGLFIFVVLAFMTLIGPVGYFYLKAKRKLHYQIWLVPLISALACMSLLGYAFISEGLGSKLRPTIFVELDQTRGLAATFGRYSVYSALQPSPYQFRDDQFAILENASDHTPAVSRWSDDGYQLSGGFASARNVHQVFVAAPVKTNSRIEIVKSTGSDSLKLTNKFKDQVKCLVAKLDGQFYFAENLAPDQTQTQSPLTEKEFSASPEVKQSFKRLVLSNAQDYRPSGRRSFFNRNRNNVQDDWDVGAKRVKRFKTLIGIERTLEDGHYIAIMDSTTEVPSVIPGAREIDGRVIVHGKW